MRYSIILPHCHGLRQCESQRHEIESVLCRVDYEILSKFSGCPTIEHAIVAGLRAARGEAVTVIEPGKRYPAAQLTALLRGLSRADFVCGRRRRRGWPKLAERIARLPRWLLLGLDTRDPDCLFWAARREVFNGLQLVPRMVRYLPALIMRQGFRVDNIYVEERPALRVVEADQAENTVVARHVAPANLLSAWWTCRRLRRTERAAANAASMDGFATAATCNSDTYEPYRAKSA